MYMYALDLKDAQIHIPTDRTVHTSDFVIPFVEHPVTHNHKKNCSGTTSGCSTMELCPASHLKKEKKI